MENSELDVWPEHWSSSESDESGYSDDSVSSSPKMETVHVAGENLFLPQDMCERLDVFKDMLSMDTWNSFSEEERQHLRTFLPDFSQNDIQEKESCVQLLLSGSNVRFGNPLLKFHEDLKAGYFRPDISKMRSLLRKTRHKDYKRKERWRIFKLVKSVLMSRQKLADAVVNGEEPSPSVLSSKKRKSHESKVKSRYFQELALIKEKVGDSSQSSEDEMFPEGSSVNMLKKNRRKEFLVGEMNNANIVLGSLSPGPNAWDVGKYPINNPYLADQPSYSELLLVHSKRRTHKKNHPGLITDDITLDEVAQRCKILKRPPLNTKLTLPKKTKVKLEDKDGEVNGGGGLEGLLVVKEEVEEDSERVDIEVVDELPDLKAAFASVPLKPVVHSPGGTSRKLKSEEPPIRKLSLESMLDSGIQTVAQPRRHRAESSDSHFRTRPDLKIKQEVFPGRTKEIQVKVGNKDTPAKILQADGLMKPIKQEIKSPKQEFTKVTKQETNKICKQETCLKNIKQEKKQDMQTKVCGKVDMKVNKSESLLKIPKQESKVDLCSKSETLSKLLRQEVKEELVPLPSFKKLKSDAAAARIKEELPSIKVESFEPPHPTPFSLSPVKSGCRLMTPATLSDLDGIDMMALPVDFDESSLDDFKSKPELMEETQACFFSLIRNIITSTEDHRIEAGELEARVKTWATGPIGPLNTWYTPGIEGQLTSALMFLTGESTDIVPEDFVPYMEFKPSMNAYQWIGAGRDSDVRLISLCNRWSERSHSHRPIGLKVDGAGGKEVVLAKGGGVDVVVPRGPAVQPSTPADREAFRIQERQRYDTPYRGFKYRVGNAEAVVGPVRSAGSTSASKARGHSLLVPHRPTCVTILELVRDAVARLPSRQGTRADIVTLLKDSQFLLEDAAENVLNSVVSGALDRLHSETDPSVKYDPKRKIWVYLHAGRTIDEFERLHALGVDSKPSRPKAARKSSKAKKESQAKEDELASAAISTQVASMLGSLDETQADDKSGLVKTKVTSRVTPVGGLQQQHLHKGVLTSRTITLHDPSALASSVKKVDQVQSSVAEPSKTKSIVKVIASGQSTATTQVRTIGKQTMSQQQVLQLKQQLENVQKKVLGAGGQGGQQQQQQQQQLIVISSGNNQQFVLDPSMKQHKQLHQLLTKHSDSSQSETTGRQASTTLALQQQLQQLILAKQQQIIAEQQKSGVKSGGQQMIVVKQGGGGGQQQSQGAGSGSPGGEGQKGGSSPLQQMILVKQGGQGGSQDLQQMILVKQQQGGEVQQISQQQLQQLLLKQQSGSGEIVQHMLLKQQQQQQSGGQTVADVQQISQSQLQQLLMKQSTSSQEQLQQILLKQGQDIQQVLVKQNSVPNSEIQQHLQQLLLKNGSGVQGEVQISQQQLQQLLLKQQSTSSGGQGEVVQQITQQQLQQLLLKQHQQQQQSASSNQQQGEVQQISQQQLQQILLKQQQQQQGGGAGASSTQSEVQQISQQQLQQLLLKQQQATPATSSQSEVQQISQQQLQQLLMKQQQQMIIVKQHDQKQIQVITPQQQSKTQALTLAQIQQLQQQQLQQKSTSTTSLLSSPRVVATRVQSGVNRATMGQYAVVSVPQQRVGVGGGGVVGVVESKAGANTTARLPSQLSGKQVLLAGKPGQNVLLGTTSSGQAVLVAGGSSSGGSGGGGGSAAGGGGGSGLAVLHQGSQQILIPSTTLKALQGLKVIPITSSATHRQTTGVVRSGVGNGVTAGQQPQQQVFARLMTPSSMAGRSVVVQQPQLDHSQNSD